MPQNFTDLLTTSGLVTVTVIIVALLKRLDAPEDTWTRAATDWIKANQFLTSLIVAFTIATIAYTVQLTGHLNLAQEFWQGFLFLWATAQALYNGQKGLAHIFRGEPN